MTNRLHVEIPGAPRAFSANPDGHLRWRRMARDACRFQLGRDGALISNVVVEAVFYSAGPDAPLPDLVQTVFAVVVGTLIEHERQVRSLNVQRHRLTRCGRPVHDEDGVQVNDRERTLITVINVDPLQAVINEGGGE
jgi:choline dehydrogenase-like flavoprotein